MEINESELFKQIQNDNSKYLNEVFDDNSYKKYVFSSKFKEGNYILRNSPPLISVCAYMKAIKCLTLMIENDSDLNLKDEKGLTLADFAVASRSIEVINLLAKKITYNHALAYAASLGYDDICEYLLDDLKVDGNKINSFGQNALHLAAMSGNADTIAVLIDHNVCDINEKDNEGNTPILLATKKNNLGALKYILTCHGVDPNVENNKGETLLHFAAQIYNTDVAQLVFGVYGKAKKMDMKQWDFFTLDCYAIENDLDLEDIDIGDDDNNNKTNQESQQPSAFNIDIKTKDGDTPLMYAAAAGCTQTFSLFMTKGASLYEQNYNNQTCLHLAVLSKDIEMVKQVLKANVIDINIQDKDGNTSLMLSVKNQTNDITELLLTTQKQIDVNLIDKEGDSCLHVSARLKNAKIVNLLLQRDDIKYNVQNKKVSIFFLFKS